MGIYVAIAWIAAAGIVAYVAPSRIRWTGPPDPALHAWFDQLASGKGLCCSFADGVSIKDVDWDTGGPNNAYRVRLNGVWINVPPDAVVTEPNKFGQAVVWPYQDGEGKTLIRCFLPGAGA